MTDDGEDAPGWVLLLAQLPASPSSPRVTLWRRARAAGAVGLQNGAWVLPGTDDNIEFFRSLAAQVRDHNGSAHALCVRTVEDQAVALRHVVLADRLYDRDLPVVASGRTFDQLFAPELLEGGYRKKYYRAVSRLVALAREGAGLRDGG